MGRPPGALLALLLAACAAPSGTPVESCGVDWHDVDALVATGTPADAPDAEAVPIECIRVIGERRIRIGFELPPGPDCHRLVAITTRESADAVSVTAFVDRVDDPPAGACPRITIPRVTEIDLQSPVGERTLLDGSR